MLIYQLFSELPKGTSRRPAKYPTSLSLIDKLVVLLLVCHTTIALSSSYRSLSISVKGGCPVNKEFNEISLKMAGWQA